MFVCCLCFACHAGTSLFVRFSEAKSHRPVSKVEWLKRLREEPARPIKPAANSRRPDRMDGDYVYVSDLGEKFKEVILILAESPTVGLMCEGVNISRSGEISLLAFSCRRGVYLFDLIDIGVKEALDAGLREILESEHVLKVSMLIFLCRCACVMSDSLRLHQYQP